MIALPEHAFDQLEQFVLSNRDEHPGAQPLELMSLSARPGLGKVITAQNYVGVITTRGGTEIEILPKLMLAGDESDQAVRKVFLTMLRTVQEAPFKTFHTAHLNTSRMRLLDLFVRMFLDEAHQLIQRGLKSDYTLNRDNETCVRGKIVFSEHIRENLLHRERIFVEYDVFSVDCPENRLVKSTALYLQRHSTDLQNRKDLRIWDFSGGYVPDVRISEGIQRKADSIALSKLQCNVRSTESSLLFFRQRQSGQGADIEFGFPNRYGRSSETVAGFFIRIFKIATYGQ